MNPFAINPFLIRKASADDAELLARLSYQTFVETFAHLNSTESMSEYLSKNGTVDVLMKNTL